MQKTASAPAKAAAPARKPAAAPEARTEKPTVVAAAAELRGEKVATVPLPQGKPRQAGELPGRIGRLQAGRPSGPRLRIFGNHRAGALRGRVGDRQAGASRAGGDGSGRAGRRVRGRRHQRARLLARTAEHRRGGRAASRRDPCSRLQARHARGADPAATASATPWPLTDRVASEPDSQRACLRGAAYADRDRTHIADGPGNLAGRARRAAGNDHRGQAQRGPSVIRGSVRHQSGRAWCESAIASTIPGCAR